MISGENLFDEKTVQSAVQDPGAAIVIYGINPIPGQLDNTVKVLAEKNTVHVYQYPTSVVKCGSPDGLHRLVREIREDVQDKTASVNPERVRIVGVSMGAFVGLNVQESLGLPLPGLYGAAGVGAAKNLMHNPMFAHIGLAFRRNGYDFEKLNAAWDDIEIKANRPPEVPVLCTLSTRDPVIPYSWAMKNIGPWKNAPGARVDIFTNKAFLHTASINLFSRSIRELIERSRSLAPELY